MKKILLSLFVLIPLFLSAQVTITMEQDGGVYKVPCVVNGAKMKFIFDTGAATVCLSESMAEYLLDNDYISKDDIIGLGASQVADGRIVDHVKIALKDVEIAGLHLKDVEAVVVEGQRAPLLLGQSAIQKLGKYTIKGNVLYIYAGESDKRTQERRKIYDKLVSFNYHLGDFEDFCDGLDSNGDTQVWVYEELTFVDTYPQLDKHKKWFATLKKFCDKVKKEPNLSSEELYKLFPEFRNKKKMLDAALAYKKAIEQKHYDIHTLMEKFPEFFQIDGWLTLDNGADVMIAEESDDYKSYIDFFRHVCGNNTYNMDKLSAYIHNYETSKEAGDVSRAIRNLEAFYELLWSYQEPTVGDYLRLGEKAYHISQVHNYSEGLKLAVASFEKFKSLTDEEISFNFYECLGNAYYLLGNCQYALSTWFKGLSINGVNYNELSSIRKFFGDFSLTPYKMFLCMQSGNADYGVAWKKAYLTYEILTVLQDDWSNRNIYIDLNTGKITPKEAVLKSPIRSERLGELIYFLDLLYFEDKGKHDRELLERAAACGDEDAFVLLQSL